MMNRILLPLLLLFSLSSAAQVRIGFGLGMSTTDVSPSDLLVANPNGTESLLMKLESANFGLHGGVTLRVPIKKFFLQPSVYFNSSSADFRVEDLQSGGAEKLLREKYQNLDIPFLMGFKLGPLRLQAGPVGHVFLDCQSELDEQIPDYEKNFEDFTFGWQAGLGLDIWKIYLDVNYEGNFSRFGEHINLFGEQLAFDDTPSRFVATIGVLF
jgi:hypothetical protein